MEKIYTVGQTAKLVKMTTETLRHYDRIGLVMPCKTDELTNYRYYSEHEIVRLNTIQALRCMDLSLVQIKEILSLNDFHKIVTLLKQAEQIADDKIASIHYAKKKMATARTFYEQKLTSQTKHQGMFFQKLPERAILIAPNLKSPTLDNLWNYHRHFHALINPASKSDFVFEDTAGVYQSHDLTGMFTICSKYAHGKGIRILPAGKYLCVNCTEETKDESLQNVLNEAQLRYKVIPTFSVQLIVLAGILQWDYQIQIFISK